MSCTYVCVWYAAARYVPRRAETKQARCGGREREIHTHIANGYLATGASAKYASRASTLFTRQLYFLFANKCVPLKIIFNIRVMWDPRDGRKQGIFWQRCTAQCFCSLRATRTQASTGERARARARDRAFNFVSRDRGEEKMIKTLTDYLRFLRCRRNEKRKIQRIWTVLITLCLETPSHRIIGHG